MKYAWMREHRDSFPLSVMCQVLEVSTSGYYDALDRAPSKRAERHARNEQTLRQAAARHSNLSLTMGPYTDPKLLDVHEAIKVLPAIPLSAVGDPLPKNGAATCPRCATCPNTCPRSWLD